MGFLAELLIGLGIPDKFVKFASWVLILLLVGLLLLLGRCAYNDHEKKVFNSGAVSEQVQSQSETINAVSSAQNVVAHPSSDQLNIVCRKYDRNCPHGS